MTHYVYIDEVGQPAIDNRDMGETWVTYDDAKITYRISTEFALLIIENAIQNNYPVQTPASRLAEAMCSSLRTFIHRSSK